MYSRLIFISSILTFLLSCSKTFVQKNDLERRGLNGQIKQIKSELYQLIPENDTFKIGENINGISFDRNSLLVFNEDGNLISSKEYLANGNLSSEEIFTYDKNEKLIGKKEIDHYGKGSFLNYQYHYNSKDSVTKVEVSNDNLMRVHRIERNSNNYPIKIQIIENNKVLWTSEIKLDSNGNIILEKEFKGENHIIKRTERKFNYQNLKAKEQVIEYTPFDTLAYNNEYSYNSNNKLELGKYRIISDSNFNEVKNTYYKNDQLKRSISKIKEDNFSLVESQKFNENGDMVEHKVETNDDKTNDIWQYIFKYDSKKNWIEKIEYKNNKPLRIVKRSIEYYQ